ncbi:MAG: lipoprotein [Hyphomicrobiaceae bacterium]
MSRSNTKTMKSRSRRGVCTVALVLLAGVLGGCGVRGSLDSPAGSGASQTKASADSGQGKKEGAAPKPHRDFILDGLIR